ncbi:similar to Saccharomyces cerevisiae YDL124W NADPH-dependent alpha-keto amide reductase [Maudiozyma barnettii]|uniref:Similar to Saccharomyces cerevisiae YDL124W NADPH-dependent alpha-keto amide reductase n=1 Tax=Maudiozyma barnettii TaxID=61262 RepID=A0A8H2VBI9_9SACH|nr:aldo-keto reductase superfamily protein [Kazachstania barnettii]CAB4252226.1 similar to Saccharomyces cerevisiae YDL124W NADPH-dependent alpha-keto amide reductase [Kazachstania barnettii]CAD1778871.1 similar to Saccharomyces cerevisiae YDL124W NADPH-dependent alpha-keto amide reductase [Kazachstania barnettii]
MSFHQDFFTLNNGNKIPAVAVVGTGTRWYKQKETPENVNSELVSQIEKALTLPGIVHIDAAEVYRTYPEVGKALSQSKKPRDEIFITDKYSTQLKVTENPIVGLDTSLERLNIDYVDLYLLHSPFVSIEKNGFTLEDAWRQMEKLYKDGKTKNIGVSNFSVEDLEKILTICEIKPQINQIEFNAFLQNQTPGIVKFCQSHDIVLEAYSPLSPLQKRPENSENDQFYKFVESLTIKYSKTEAQILLRWVTRRGVVAVTTSSKFSRVQDAQNLFTFDLTDEEVEEITKLGLKHKAQRLYWNEEYDKYNVQSQN